MNILIGAKPTSENFISNYTNYLPEFVENSILLVTNDTEQVRSLTHNTDVLILEWANDFTAAVLDRKLPCKVVVRIHDHEVRKGRIHNINWQHVDAVWFINPEIQKQFHSIYPNVPSFFLPNAVDPAPFKENLSTEKKIGLLSLYARTRKRFDRAFKVIRLLKDEGWQLHIRCEPWNPEKGPTFEQYRKMAEGLPVVWDLREVNQKPDDKGDWYGNSKSDINEFWQDKAVGLCTSEHEGFSYQTAEAALCGAMPAVCMWEFGNPFVFWRPYVHRTVENLADAIRDYQPSSEHRRYVEDFFHPRVLIPQLLEKLTAI